MNYTIPIYYTILIHVCYFISVDYFVANLKAVGSLVGRAKQGTGEVNGSILLESYMDIIAIDDLINLFL